MVPKTRRSAYTTPHTAIFLITSSTRLTPGEPVPGAMRRSCKRYCLRLTTCLLYNRWCNGTTRSERAHNAKLCLRLGAALLPPAPSHRNAHVRTGTSPLREPSRGPLVGHHTNHVRHAAINSLRTTSQGTSSAARCRPRAPRHPHPRCGPT